MEREVVNPGARFALSTLIENLQSNIQLNTWRDFDHLIDEFGVNCDVVSGQVPATDTTLEVTGVGTTNITVTDGIGLTTAFNYIDVTGNSAPKGVSSLSDGQHTVYIKYIGDTYEPVEIINGFLYGDYGNTVDSREHTSYEVVFDDAPGVSGLELATFIKSSGPVNIDSITDKRTENVLKLKHKVFPETIVKTDRNSDINGTLTANYIGTKGIYSILLNNAGLTADVEISASGLEFMHDWRHAHNVEVTQGSRTVLDSVNAIGAHTELEGAFRKGIINFQDGNGDRWIVTKIIPSKPYYPGEYGSDVELSVALREIIPDELVTKALKDSIRSYTVKEISIADNINANTSVSSWRSTIANYQTQNPSWDVDDLYAVSGLEEQAAGIWEQGYAYDVGGKIAITSGYYEDGLEALGMRETGGSSISSALTTIDTRLGFNQSANNTLDADLTVIARDILDKEADIRTHPDKGKRSFEALCNWETPTLVDSEDIVKYQLKVFRLSTVSTSVPDSTPLITLLNNYVAQVSQETTSESSVAAVKINVKRDTVVNNGEGTSTTSRVYVTNMTDIAVGQAILIIQDPSGTPVRAKSVVTAIGSNYIDLFSAIGFTPTSATNDSVQAYEEVYESINIYYVEGTAKTTYAFSIDVDQSYMVYIRSISKYNVASDWSPGYKFSTNDLTSDSVSLNDIVKEDKAFLAKAKEVEKREIKREFETQILALQQQIAALPTQTQMDNVTSSVTDLDTRIGDLEEGA